MTKLTARHSYHHQRKQKINRAFAIVVLVLVIAMVLATFASFANS